MINFGLPDGEGKSEQMMIERGKLDVIFREDGESNIGAADKPRDWRRVFVHE